MKILGTLKDVERPLMALAEARGIRVFILGSVNQ
jgi:hypothetical protein